MAQPVGDLVVNLDADTASFNEQVERAKTQLGTFGNSANNAAKVTADMAAKQEIALQSLLEKIDPNIKAMNRLDEQYTQLISHFVDRRIDGEQFVKFSNTINKTREELLKSAAVAANDMPAALSKQAIAAQKAGISVGQYRAAMQMLPAQMTDIVTQLAGGQNPFLILIQQGGQIKDSFGGLRGTFYALSSMINPAYLGVAAFAGAVGYLGYEVYQSHQQTESLNQSMAKTGNISGQTATGLKSLTDQIAKNIDVSKSAAAAAVAQSTGLGLSVEQIKLVSETALSMSKTTGQSVEDLVKQLGKISQDPLKSFIDINQQYNFANLALYEQVKRMIELGDKTGATKLILDSLKNSQQQFGDETKGTMEEISGFWDNLIEKLKTTQFWYDKVAQNATTARLPEVKMSAGPVFDRINEQMGNSTVDPNPSRTMAENWKNIESNAAGLLGFVNDVNAKTRQFNKDQVDANQKADEFLKSARTHAEMRNDLEKDYKRQLDAGYITQEKYNKLISAVNEKYKDPKQREEKTPTGDRAEENAQAELLALQTQLRVLQQHTGINDTISQQRKELWQTESKFSVLEEAAQSRKLTKQEQSLLTNKDQIIALAEQKAILGDQIAAQERLNKLQDAAAKYATQMAEKTSAMKVGAGLSDRQAQRQMEEAQLRQGWLNKGGNLNDQGFKTELKAQRNYYAEQDAMREDWISGAKKSLANYAEEATNYSRMASDATTSIIDGSVDAISSGVMDILDGTKSLSDGFKSIFAGIGEAIIQTLVRMAAQWLVYQAVQLAVGKAGQVAASSGLTANAQAMALQAQLAAYASTAAIPIVGPGLAPVAMATAAGVTEPLVAAIAAVSLAGMAHSGIDSVPATGTWLLEKGERVVTSQTSAKLDQTLEQVKQTSEDARTSIIAGGVTQNINVNGNPDDRTMALLENAVARGAERGYQKVANHLASGQGQVSKALGNGWATGRRKR
ncbi:phage tail length tape measure family protein [Candidatus Symbiopectobacterium sp. NZEC151]|uniref:phage tail length tape measure family protein n=1 Tax=Candidatus Symbiopectobacterium sp. NZEC151 TaxID=2820470 RepID=UPI002226B694|nr:phage tail length tape measure family protein [Candidatus Symbiopectobacterium sp. NZEC151]MCW2473425.1 phage tail length tape measure family protein [Candidatus Symbiopectobacterium sp. NZEC151]